MVCKKCTIYYAVTIIGNLCTTMHETAKAFFKKLLSICVLSATSFSSGSLTVTFLCLMHNVFKAKFSPSVNSKWTYAHPCLQGWLHMMCKQSILLFIYHSPKLVIISSFLVLRGPNLITKLCKPGLNGIKIKKPNKLDSSTVYKMNSVDCPCQYAGQTEMLFKTWQYKDHIQAIKFSIDNSNYVSCIRKTFRRNRSIENTLEIIHLA